MKTAVSLPDDLYDEADRLARHLNTSRSRLYAEAIREYVARHDPHGLTDALNRVCDAVDPTEDAAVTRVGRALLERVEW